MTAGIVRRVGYDQLQYVAKHRLPLRVTLALKLTNDVQDERFIGQLIARGQNRLNGCLELITLCRQCPVMVMQAGANNGY